MFFSLCRYVDYNLENSREVAEHQFTCNSEYNDAEELTDDIERCLAKVLGQPVRSDEYSIKRDDTKDKGNAQAGDAILRRNGQ